MKHHIIKTLLLALAAAFSVGQTAYAQEEQARDLFISHAANPGKGQPGAKIRLELLRESRRSFVPLDTRFHAGDRVKLHFEVNFTAYVTIYNLGTSGRVAKLYPARSRYAVAAASTNYVVPASANEWFEFDNTPGAEKLNFTFSSIAPVKRPAKPAAKPSPKSATPTTGGNNKKQETDVVIVEPGGRTLGGEEAAEEDSNAESDQALTNGRDLRPVQLKDAYYVVGNAQQLRQRVGILIVLDHR